MITRDIRHHLSKDIPKNENDAFTSKYLRITSITKMAAHWGVDFFKFHALPGNSICTTQEGYLDQNIHALTLLVAYALKG